MSRPTATSSAETNGVLVEVQSRYVEDQSLPMTRLITDGLGDVEEVKGPGVVGEQPVLSPGEGFRYTSGAVLPTERGTMHGTYQMHRADGAQFDATIAPFLLERPHSLN
jgi:uncharacterized protein affecting Mg2+/Co2+ transport